MLRDAAKIAALLSFCLQPKVLQMQQLQLVLTRRQRRPGHRVTRALGLGERNHLSDVTLPRQQGHDAVEAVSEATHRRCAVLEGAEQVAEALLDLLGREAEERENL